MNGKNAFPDRLVGAAERRALVPYSDMHVSRLEKAGKFPRRVKLGPGRVAWRLSEIMTWIGEKEADRNAREDAKPKMERHRLRPPARQLEEELKAKKMSPR